MSDVGSERFNLNTYTSTNAAPRLTKRDRHMMASIEAWRNVAVRKKNEQQARIPQSWRLPLHLVDINTTNVLNIPKQSGLLTAKELHITESYDATSLAAELSSGKLSSVEVAIAFCKRAAIAHQVTNCLTEIFFDRAVTRATELDEYYAKHGRPTGPLHGVPVSLKDLCKVKGLDASIGYAALAFSPSKKNSAVVDLLLKAGAVLYCKTNVPQTMAALDSHNNVFGRVLNPGNLKLTAGGSSGGEGALISMRGSILGVGTDVGGSIRVPAMCNDLYGVKPSVGRIPYADLESGKPDGASTSSIQSVAGPMAHSLRDCELFFKTISSMSPWNIDPAVTYGFWNMQGESRSKSDIVIGIVRRDGLIDPLPPVNNVIEETAKALKAAGIKTVEMDITSIFSKCQPLGNRLLGLDGGNAAFDIMDQTNEPLSPWLEGRMRRKAPLTLDQTRELHGHRKALQTEFLNIWRDANGQQVDAFICPVAPHPVPEIDKWNGVSYTLAFNLLDVPAGVIPVRPVREDDLKVEIPSTQPLGSWDKRNQELWTDVDRNVYLESPLSIQVVVPRLQERRLVGAMAIVEEALRGGSATVPSFARL